MPRISERKMNVDEVSLFCEQLTLILSAGMPLYDGLEAMSEGYKGTSDYPIFQEICDVIDKSGTLTEALKASGIFPEYMINMIEIGERTGKLEWVSQELSAYYKREGKVRRELRSAVTYPVTLLVMMSFVIVLLLTKVMPVFNQVFDFMGFELGTASSTLENLGVIIGYSALAIVGALILITAICGALMFTKLKPRVVKFVTAIVPGAKQLSYRVANERFAGVMSMMLGSGFPIEEALNYAPDIVGSPVVRDKLRKVNELTAAGRDFTDAINDVGLFTPMYCRMVRVGFSSGQGDTALMKVAEIYEDEVDRGFSKMVASIEPTLIALLALLVGAILLSVMLPMASVLSGIV